MEIVFGILALLFTFVGVDNVGKRNHEREMAKLNYHATYAPNGFRVFVPNAPMCTTSPSVAGAKLTPINNKENITK